MEYAAIDRQTERYTVINIRSGQTRAYGDSEYEYVVLVEKTPMFGPDANKLKPWVLYGDVEKLIAEEELARKTGKMIGGESPESRRKTQREWAKKIVNTLCYHCREKGDADGLDEKSAEAYFAPTLKKLEIRPSTGEIQALIVSAYTD